MEESLKAKRSNLAKTDAKMVVAIIVLALTVILFICNVINVADAMEELKPTYGSSAYDQDALRYYQISYTVLLMKHIVNITIASLIVGVFAKKRSEIASEIKSRNIIKLEANTIPCPKCGAEIEREETNPSLNCPECGAKYKNPFYKG